MWKESIKHLKYVRIYKMLDIAYFPSDKEITKFNDVYAFIRNFEQALHITLMFLFLTLNFFYSLRTSYCVEAVILQLQ